jgi:hypothetical protein
MARRAVQLLVIVLLAMMSVDLLGADCVGDLRSAAVAHAALFGAGGDGEDDTDTGDGCCCCTPAAATGAACLAGPPPTRTPGPIVKAAMPCAGVRPVPYHPPLLLG